MDPLDDTFFDHSPNGVIDRWNGGALATPYLDQNGSANQPEAVDWPDVEYDYNNDRVVQRDGLTWPLAIDRHPDAPSTMTNRVAAGASGTAVYATWIGPRNGSDLDYGPPTEPVIAALMPDGTATWFRLPDGWWIADSNNWGTLLVNTDLGRTQLAWFDPTS